MIKAIRRFFERGRKGYCRNDLWSWEYFFSKLISQSLREFKANCHSYPSEDITWEGWMAILDEMIECFDEQWRAVDNIPCKPGTRTIDFGLIRKRQEYKANKLHRGLELLEKYYYDLWD